ncbi:MAG: glycoside hydrolase [Bacteroidetes bacterium]|nr:glycoside hydrolase [Bacteroidota bacterium]MBU1720166.1 glycoside hydrolase [Bacteroidota bacterium]
MFNYLSIKSITGTHLLFLLVSALFSSCSGDQNAKPKPTCTYQFEAIDSINTIRQVENQHLAFPDIQLLPDGRIVMVYREGDIHVDKSGKIVMQISSDKGKTWSEPATVIDDPESDDRDPSISYGNDSLLRIVYFRYVRNIKTDLPKAISQVYFATSDKSLVSFPNSIKTSTDSLTLESAFVKDSLYWCYPDSTPIKTRGVSSRAIEDNDHWIIPVYGGNPAVTDTTGKWISPCSRISFIEGNEKKWTERYVNEKLLQKVWLQEPSVLKITNSLWVMHIRTAKGNPFDNGMMAQSISNDGGITWSAWFYLGFTGHSPFLFKCSNGLIVSAFRWLDKDFKNESTAFIWSADSCMNWSDVVQVEPAGSWDCAYPSIAETGKDTLLFVWYSENGTKLKARNYRIVRNITSPYFLP